MQKPWKFAFWMLVVFLSTDKISALHGSEQSNRRNAHPNSRIYLCLYIWMGTSGMIDALDFLKYSPMG